MKTPKQKPIVEQAPEFVAAPAIARRLSVTGRYVLQMAEQGRIPCVRLGRKCVRFSPDAVAKALGLEWREGVQSIADHQVPADGVSMDAEIDDLEINVDPYEALAPSCRSDADLEKALKQIEENSREGAN